MGGGNLFSILISTIKSRFASITSKIRLWTNWNFIKSRIITRIREFFTKLFDIKPKHKDDYFTVFGWMISKKLATSIIIICGVVSIWYILSVKQVFAGMNSSNGVRTYKYNSVQLRLAKDKVRILGKSGYLAYEGQVDKGYASGQGTLYDPEGNMVYLGNFEKSRFEGDGKSYYDNGALKYTGSFHNNEFDGHGLFYRASGSLLYDGNFSAGLKSGEGTLYAENGSQVFTGSFASDEIVYATFIGKTTTEAGAMYTGDRRVWQGDGTFCIYMSDIGALYSGHTDEEKLSDDVVIDSVYVLSDNFRMGTWESSDLNDIRDSLGEPIYEGNSAVILPEAVAVNVLNEYSPAFSGEVKLIETRPYTDVSIVSGMDEDYSVYLTSYEANGLIYTFVSEKRDGNFRFYYMSRGDEEAE